MNVYCLDSYRNKKKEKKRITAKAKRKKPKKLSKKDAKIDAALKKYGSHSKNSNNSGDI